MLTAKQLTNGVASTARDYNKSAFSNVLAIGLYGLQFGAKDSARRTCRDALIDQGMAYSTAARQVAFGMDMAAHIKTKYPEHAFMAELAECKGESTARDVLAAFMGGLNVRSGNEAALWVKTDGTALSAEKRAELFKVPAKAEPKAAEADPVKVEEPAKVKAPAEVEAPAMVEVEAIDPVEAVLAVMATLSDEQLAMLQGAINDERKARKASLSLAA